MRKSKLVQALDMDSDELIKYLKDKEPKIKKALTEVIGGTKTYQAAAGVCGITKCGIYEHLQSLHVKKYGRRYEQKNRN